MVLRLAGVSDDSVERRMMRTVCVVTVRLACEAVFSTPIEPIVYLVTDKYFVVLLVESMNDGSPERA